MSRSVFLSYCRADTQQVQRLAQDVRALGYSPWLDQEIGGGQAWWDEILSQIRRTDIVVVALSAAALESVACLREYEYAAALGKPILPICVNADFAPALLPSALAALQVVTWKPDDASAALRLSRALMNMGATPAIPAVEPTRPPAPLSYLASLHERVTAAQELGLKEQSALLLELKQRVRAGKDRKELRALMQALRARFDLFASVAEELDQVLREQERDHTADAARSALEDSAVAGSERELMPVESESLPERRVSAASASPVGLPDASSTAHSSLSPVETPIDAVTSWRKRKRLMLRSVWAACSVVAGIGLLAYVFRSPTAEKLPTTHAPLPAPAVTSDHARGENPSSPLADRERAPAPAPEAPPKESMQPPAAPPATTAAAPTPKKHKPHSVQNTEAAQGGTFARVVDALHTWKVTAKDDCEPDSVRPRDCMGAEKVTANLNPNGTVTWGACSCKLNAAARKAIEDTAVWML
ncbi:MAG TPA: toll/interleukin-1 receptor domain-containing protein [Polyangiales bacterium]|nr:toll/interleukin-1 receptor domain-containing protein [Polyangiales bacterium]